ncbi:MAG: YfiR family protein [Bacteroidales bacterium]|nr:YfiR family protein [Bacteroidales bacterium]
MRKAVSILTLLLTLNLFSFSQTDISRAEALFIYNFSRLIEWPANYKTGPFVIGVIGNSPISGQLEGFTSGKQVGSQPIQVKKFSSAAEISTCHILFVPFSETKNLESMLPKLSGKSTLVITEKGGAIDEGAAINFVVIGDKLKFELSPGNISTRQMQMSSKLNEMAYKVY